MNLGLCSEQEPVGLLLGHDGAIPIVRGATTISRHVVHAEVDLLAEAPPGTWCVCSCVCVCACVCVRASSCVERVLSGLLKRVVEWFILCSPKPDEKP